MITVTKTTTVGVSPGHEPSAGLLSNGKLLIDLGRDRVEVALGNNPRESLETLRDDLDRLLTESKEAA